jgi:single-strand DNA-binding protein
MAKSVNKVILLGHVGKDPEIRSTTGGTLVANLSLATSERYKDREERTEWHNLVAFSRGAEIIRDYVKKGSRLYVEGKIQTRSWDDKNSGEKQYRTEVLVLDITLLTPQENGGTNSGTGRSAKQEAKGRGRGDDNTSPDYGDVGITDDDIPF